MMYQNLPKCIQAEVVSLLLMDKFVEAANIVDSYQLLSSKNSAKK
jgi:hypothetical protein